MWAESKREILLLWPGKLREEDKNCNWCINMDWSEQWRKVSLIFGCRLERCVSACAFVCVFPCNQIILLTTADSTGLPKIMFLQFICVCVCMCVFSCTIMCPLYIVTHHTLHLLQHAPLPTTLAATDIKIYTSCLWRRATDFSLHDHFIFEWMDAILIVI